MNSRIGIAAAFGFFLVTVSTRFLCTYPSQLSQQFRLLQDQGEHFNAIFLGSSYTLCHIQPTLFDEEIKKAGGSTRTTLLARPRMDALATDFYLNRLLAMDLPNLKYLFVDVSMGAITRKETNLFHPAEIEVSTPGNILEYLKYRNPNLNNPYERASLFYLGLNTFANLTNLGQGYQTLAEAFTSIGRTNRNIEIYRPKEFCRDIAENFPSREYAEGVNKLKRHLASQRCQKKSVKPNIQQDYIERWRAQIKSKGIQPIFTVSAIVDNQPCLNDEALVRFDDPEKFPEIYNPSLRVDKNHLTEEGAIHYTKLVAQQVSSLLEPVLRPVLEKSEPIP